MTDWRNEARCREVDPEIFFPIGETAHADMQAEEAKAICRTCPVADQCLQFALTEGADEGVFGGLTGKERASLNRSVRRQGLSADHATEKAKQARQPTRERTLQTIFDDNTVRLFGGHLAWTGRVRPHLEGRSYTPKALAFIVDRGREPEGRVLNDCGNSECVLPAHVADDAERMRCGTRPGYQRHQRNGETPCDACRQASADDRRQYGYGDTQAAA